MIYFILGTLSVLGAIVFTELWLKSQQPQRRYDENYFENLTKDFFVNENECDECGKELKSKQGVRVHKSRTHDGTYGKNQ